MGNFTHYTVMKNEAVDALECVGGKIYVDCTLGGGGHSELILQKISIALINKIENDYLFIMHKFINKFC